MRRYAMNRSSFDEAKRIRETFTNAPADKVEEVDWQWPKQVQEIGTCEAVMYSSSKWQKRATDFEDYKHVAEGKQYLYAIPGSIGFQREYGRGGSKLAGPMRSVGRLPSSYAVLAKILGVQARLYVDDAGNMPKGADDGYYQIDLAGWLGATRVAGTGELVLFIYTDSGVHCLIVGEILDIEKDGIVG